MKYYIRKVKTTSDSIAAVQIIKYENRKRVVVKHMGFTHNKDEVIIFWNNAERWITEQTKQIPLFTQQEERFISLEQFEYLGFQYTFLYETLYKLQARLGYTCFGNKLLNDLITIHIIEPASKLRSLELLKTYF